MNDRYYLEYCNRFKKLHNLTKDVLRPILKTPKASLLYTINRNWKSIMGEKYVDFAVVEKVVLLKNQKTANLYVTTFNLSTSFFINNSKSYILDKINNHFGYKAIVNLYLKEVPKTVIKTVKMCEIDDNKLIHYNTNNNTKDETLRNKLNELAIEVYKCKTEDKIISVPTT
ncbi:MAG: DUF721 domain-containing protein [Rickettsiales bacterium]|jgi:hypothetical protein|nr:DUF721 domain-containing protein [Rickettsiales bacterium]